MEEANPLPKNIEPQQPGISGNIVRFLLLAAVVVLMVLLWKAFGDRLSLDRLAEHESELLAYKISHPLLIYGVAFLIYVAVTGLSLPGATAMTLVYAWLFGFWRTLLLVSFASTLGATLAFLLSRFLLRQTIQNKFGDRLQKFNESLEREGAFYLFTLRLIPAVPFFVINVVMGLTPMRTRTFWWVSQVGMLAGTAVYVYAGASVPSIRDISEKGILTPQLFAALLLLGVFPFAVKKIMGRLRPSTTSTEV